MKNLIIRSIFFTLLIIPSLLLSSCTGGKHLRSNQVVDAGDIKGLFTLILYTTAHYDSLMTIAILDIEGDGYELVPYAPGYDYTTSKSVSGKDAVERSVNFISSHHAFNHYQTKRILDEAGNTIGYELRPLYQPFVYGEIDVLEVDYWHMGSSRVKVTIKLIHRLEEMFTRGRQGY